MDIRTPVQGHGTHTYLPLNDTTNQIGRYASHVHHLSGPLPTPANGYQFTLWGTPLDGGSVETKFKWGITVHGSHTDDPGQRRLQLHGAAVATEDGSESFKVFDHNFALRGMGEPKRRRLRGENGARHGGRGRLVQRSQH